MSMEALGAVRSAGIDGHVARSMGEVDGEVQR